MPKERFHLLLANEASPILHKPEKGYTSQGYTLDEESRFFYLLGSILPDALFYDLPFFASSRTGSAMHRVDGKAVLDLCERKLEEGGHEVSPDIRAFVLGLSVHFMADAFWHPVINHLSALPFPPWRKFNLSRRLCHHWLESELESYWLRPLGPVDGYLPLVRRFRRERARSARCIGFFREILLQVGLAGVPSEKRIGRCLFWQTLLIEQFAHPTWAAWGPRLLASKLTNPLGVLIVPLRPILLRMQVFRRKGARDIKDIRDSREAEEIKDANGTKNTKESTHNNLCNSLRVLRRRQCEFPDFQDIPDLFDEALMARAVIFLASRLRELQARS